MLVQEAVVLEVQEQIPRWNQGGSGGPGVQLPATFRDPTSGVGGPGPTSAPTPNGFGTLW